MIAVLGGVGAAIAFATATLCAALSTRMIGAPSVLAWVMLTGFCVVAPWAALEGVPDHLDWRSVVWLTAGGLGNVLGLLLAYSALRIGKVGIVAPIVSTEGAIAALISVTAGEPLAGSAAVALAVIAVGILLAASTGEPDDATIRARSWRVPLYAMGAAFSFGISLYATARASAELPVGWAVVPPRLAGVLAVTLPLAAGSRLRLTLDALPFVLAAGVAEVAGFASFAVGSRHGIAVSAVLASQFAAIAGVAAFFVFRERLTRLQLAGVAAVVAGVAILSILEA